MNLPSCLLDWPPARLIGWGVLHSLWQGALVGAAFALLRSSLRNRSANARYVIGCAALAFILTGPVLTVLCGSVASGQAGHAVREPIAAVNPSLSDATGAYPRSPGFGTPSFFQQCAELLGMVAPLLAPLWLLGVAFFSVKLTRSWWWTRTIRAEIGRASCREWG